MPNRPILLFGQKERSSWKNPQTPIAQRMHFPPHGRQVGRLSPQFESLQILTLQNTAAGVEPEYTLVFEIGNDVQTFITAIKCLNNGAQKKFTQGGYAELLFDYVGTAEAEDDFFETDAKGNKKDKLPCKVYCLSTNLRAMTELLSLWNSFRQDPTFKFPLGKTGLRDVFKQLKDIRRWGVSERLVETGILDDWRSMLPYLKTSVFCELELAYSTSVIKQRTRENDVAAMVQRVGGRILQSSIINDIKYHALLVELPRRFVETILANTNVELAIAEQIMFFRSTGQSVVTNGQNINSGVSVNVLTEIIEEPIIALFDGLPQENHPYLQNLLSVDDPDNFRQQYQAAPRKHGTAMASLIAYGDLNRIEYRTTRKIYVRPIMKPNANGIECAEDFLLVDKIHASVRRLFENIGSGPVAPQIKVINLSIGDKSRIFDRTVSPLARLLDWLSYKYKVLFIVSAGNHEFHNDVLELQELFSDFASKSLAERTNTVIKTINDNGQYQRLLSPAESMNALTVGAAFSDYSTFAETPSQLIAPCVNGISHIVSAIGKGVNRSIKPDIIFHGGRFLIRQDPVNNNQAQMLLRLHTRAPGILSAAPFNTGTDRELYSSGTSNSAALITHEAARCYDILSELVSEGSAIPNESFALLIRAMLVHGAEWGELYQKYITALSIPGRSKAMDTLHRFFGYGFPDIAKALSCTEKKVTLIGVGSLKNGEADVFSLPLPFDFSGKPHRRLTITLASYSPIVPTRQRYRATQVWFEIQPKSSWKRTDADDEAVARGTLQHEIFINDKAEVWDENDSLKIKVNCSYDADKDSTLPVPYAVMVSFEMKDAVGIDIYERIAEKVKPRITTR